MTLSLFTRHRGTGPSSPLTADACPRLASGVTFERTADHTVWIASVHGVPSSRLSPAVVELLRAMDGATALHVLHDRFAPAEPPDGFLQLVGRFRDSGLLEGGTRRTPGRLVYRPPFTVQIATRRAPAIFGRLERLIVPVSRRVLWGSVAVVLGTGALAAVLQATEVRRILSQPVPLTGIVIVIAALAVTTLLHEGAHGLALTRFGGTPRRAGVMLFYLTPAFFVDVTDGWRLSERRHRVTVALAGPIVHALVASVALVTALVVPNSDLRDALLLLAVSCIAIVAVNLIPFVRFDGYIAMMSALDEPNLRARAIRDGTGFVTRVLYGGPRAPKSLDRWWSGPFGLASLLGPVVLVSWAVLRTAHALAGGGPVLGAAVIALEAVVVLVGGGMLVRALRRVFRSGVSRPRFFVVTSALLGAVAVAGAVVPVPATVTYGFVSDGDRVLVVQAAGRPDAPVSDGARVALLTRGLLVSEDVGDGTVRRHRAETTSVPLDALLPVRADAVSVPAQIVAVVDVSARHGRLPATGEARVETGTHNLWQALWRLAVESPLSPVPGTNEKG